MQQGPACSTEAHASTHIRHHNSVPHATLVSPAKLLNPQELGITVISCPQVLLLLDIDFMVSNSLNSAGLQDQIYQAVQAEQLLVLPAFEASLEDEAGQQLVDAACAGGACTPHTAMCVLHRHHCKSLILSPSLTIASSRTHQVLLVHVRHAWHASHV